MPIHRLSILGVGLLGGSLGMAVKSVLKSCEILGYGHRASTLEQAQHIGAIDWATTNLDQSVEGADMVVLCTPVGFSNPF